MKKLVSMGLALAMACSVFTGCSGGSSSTTASGSAQTEAVADSSEAKVLNFGCENFSDNLDPATIQNAAWAVSRYGIGESLFKFDDTMTAQPNLCDTYTVNDDKTEWVFHLRDGIKFSTGTDVTPTAVIAAWNRMYDKEADGSSTSALSVYLPKDDIKELTADDSANTVTVKLNKAYADLTAVVAHPYYQVIDVSDEDSISTNPIGTGPYAVKSINTGVSIEMVKNEYYWNGDVPFDTVNLIFMGDSTTKAMAIKSGSVDLVENVTTATDLAELKADTDNYYVSETNGVRCAFSYINQAEGKFLANDTLRKAVLMAMDDETTCNVTVGGVYTAGASVIPSNLDYGYDQLTDATAYDLDAAKKLLDDAGIVDTDGDGIRELDGENIELQAITYDGRMLKELMEATQVMLEQLDIKVNVQTLDASTEWNQMVAGDYDLCASNWMTAQIGDPQSYLANWYSKSNENYCSYKNDDFDKDYEALINETDKDKRKELIVKLQQYIIDDAGVMVYGYYHSTMTSNPAKVADANIHTADYYWLTTEIKPAN